MILNRPATITEVSFLVQKFCRMYLINVDLTNGKPGRTRRYSNTVTQMTDSKCLCSGLRIFNINIMLNETCTRSENSKGKLSLRLMSPETISHPNVINMQIPLSEIFTSSLARSPDEMFGWHGTWLATPGLIPR